MEVPDLMVLDGSEETNAEQKSSRKKLVPQENRPRPGMKVT